MRQNVGPARPARRAGAALRRGEGRRLRPWRADVAGAALEGGATWLAVALVEEGARASRRRGRRPGPAALRADGRGDRARRSCTGSRRPSTATVASPRRAGAAAGVGRPVQVHLKVDTGMHRVGAAPCEALAVAKAIAEAPELELQGLFTHLAVADEPDDPFTARQLRRVRRGPPSSSPAMASGRRSSTRRTRRARSPTPPPASTSSVAASPATATCPRRPSPVTWPRATWPRGLARARRSTRSCR